MVIFPLMASNTSWCLDSQHHNVSFLRSSFNGFFPSVLVGWSGTLGSSPYLGSSPVPSYTVVHPSAWMVSTFFGSRLMPSGVSSCPKNLHYFISNCILSGLNLKLFLKVSKLGTAISWLMASFPLESTSSAMPVTPCTVLMTASSLSWKTSKLTVRLKG